MEIQLLLPENEFKEKVIVIIPCAGEGTRIKEISQDIPKSLIKVVSLNNIPIIDHLIYSLNNLRVQKIVVITGHLGSQLKDHFNKNLKLITSIKEKLILIDSGQEYKKGPIYSFLSFTNNEKLFRKNYIFIVFPCDTYFENALINEIFNILALNLEKVNNYPILFYKDVNTTFFKQSHLHPMRKIPKFISSVKVKTMKGQKLLKQIKKVDLNLISRKTFKLMVPVLILDYNSIVEILRASNLIPAKTISEVLNYLIKRGKKIFIFKVNSNFNFYDIDDKYDLILLNSREKKMDNSSFE